MDSRMPNQQEQHTQQGKMQTILQQRQKRTHPYLLPEPRRSIAQSKQTAQGEIMPRRRKVTQQQQKVTEPQFIPQEPNNRQSQTRQLAEQQHGMPMLHCVMPKQQPIPRLPLEDVEGCDSFINSLSLGMNEAQQHPLASLYHKHFATQREGLLKNLFDYCNAKVFGNLLPKDLKISFHPQLWEHSGLTFAWIDKHGKPVAEIFLSVRHNENPERVRNTLVHELCHVATYLIDGVCEKENNGHGVLFHKWGKHVNSVFPQIQTVKQFDTSVTYTNFLMKCRECGIILGQHLLFITKCFDCGGNCEWVNIYDPRLKLLGNVIWTKHYVRGVGQVF